MKCHQYSCYLILFFLIVLTQCKREEGQAKWLVISQAKVRADSANKTLPCPPPLLDVLYYADLNLVFDSTNKIYLYQTEKSYNHQGYICLLDSDTQDTLAIEGSFIQKKGESTKPLNPEYPAFLGLKPAHLLAFDDADFFHFIEDNNDIFRFDTNFNDYRRFFVIASQTDTIKNPAFYKFCKLISKKQCRGNGIQYDIRRTTEEENYVISCKASGKPYDPAHYQWSKKFLDGNSRPFTEEYSKVEKNCISVRKAKETYKQACTRAIVID